MWRAIASVLALTISSQAFAQANAPEVEACRASSLLALRETSPSLKDVVFDIESLAISKADTKVGETPVTMVIIGEAWLERKSTDNARRFVCLIGEKGKVLLTFFTAQ